MSQTVNVNKEGCQVCGGSPPPGHLICEACWPLAALETGRAAVCAECARPRLVEKLVKGEDGRLICPSHLPESNSI